MPEPRTISASALDEMTVFVDGAPFKASYLREKVIVAGANHKIAPARRVGDQIETSEGTEVRRMLLGERIPTEQVDDVLAAALIVSALLGNPRDDGKAPRCLDRPYWSGVETFSCDGREPILANEAAAESPHARTLEAGSRSSRAFVRDAHSLATAGTHCGSS